MSTDTESKASSATRSKSPSDAVQMLKADHREVEEMFAKFENARTPDSKTRIAGQICEALTVHTQIEEELFYPACEAAGVDQELLDEAKVEHAGAKDLIAQILEGSAEDELWDAKVNVLREQIEHHVKEEEEREGIFAQARKADLDLDVLGEAMAVRKNQLTAS